MDTTNAAAHTNGHSAGTSSSVGFLVISWVVVGIPMAWGVYRTFIGALNLFK